MAFFARPNLDNTQFKQLEGSVLTLSGQTQIATISGLTLTDGAGGNVIISASGWSGASTVGYVMAQDIDGVVKLMPSTASGTSNYYGVSPTTCTVGGLLAGTNVYGTGITAILQQIIAPTLYPTITLPSISSFNLHCSGTTTLAASVYEVGRTLSLAASIEYNPGTVSCVYSGNSMCSGGAPSCYIFTSMFGIPDVCISCTTPSFCRYVGDGLTCGSHVVIWGNNTNTVSTKIKYTSGATIYDSSGAYYSAVTSGYTDTCTKSFSGVYPWYWGNVASGGATSGANRPTSTCIKSIITGGTGNKCVQCSTCTICTTFNSTTDDYIWFATPIASTIKTCWYIDALNKGTIGGGISPGCNLFPDPEAITNVNSSLGCWSGQSYNVYVSNYQSASVTQMELRNS